MTSIDSLVDSYLGAVAQAGADLSPQRREELLTDLREHITTARAELDPETEADVRTILDRLGDPASIIAEARQDEPPQPMVNSQVPPRRSSLRVWVVVAVVAVLGVALAACIAGVLGLFFFATSEGKPVESVEPVPVSSPAQPGPTG
ncbi:hypothetical protein GA0074695_2791 [Micromonospora viridifaciens]|uniref:Uncharacterized protein n=1 Tax=Micromonospora viridifaciens TaxID=1881 RepID=A0A1C4WWF9_MICVI|nr:hypothetical protein [Micromonospora viridifaciens]SCF00211.1 hypothetical protein GA0074695_2791 [Micromonospora viridifaciens]